MAFINQELAQVPGCHVGWDLHNFTHAIFTEDLHNLWQEIQGFSLSEQKSHEGSLTNEILKKSEKKLLQ